MNSSPEEALFALMLAKPAEKRAAFLDRAWAGNLRLEDGRLSILPEQENCLLLPGVSDLAGR